MNATLDGADDSITFAPTHLGSQPAVYTDEEGDEVQPLPGCTRRPSPSTSGATEHDMSEGDGICFQISGPDAYIEFSNQQGSAGADVDGSTTAGWGHVHTIYRDPANDYAGSVTQQEGSGMGGGPGAGGAPPGGQEGTPPGDG